MYKKYFDILLHLYTCTACRYGSCPAYLYLITNLKMDEVLFGSLYSSKRSVARLNVEGDLHFLYICTESDGQELGVTLTDGEEAWTGRLTQRQLSELARKVNSELNDFVAETLDALSGTCSTGQFVYCVNKSSENRLKLSWKRIVGSEGVRFELGSITVHKEPSAKEVHCSFLNYLIEQTSSLKSEVSQLQEVTACLESERKNTISRLEGCVDIKESLEKELFGKFRTILNSKKAKVRHLLDQLSEPAATVVSDDSEADSPSPTRASGEPPSPKRVTGPVKRRKRVAKQIRSGPLQVPHPPPLKSPAKPLSSEADSFESDKLLELM